VPYPFTHFAQQILNFITKHQNSDLELLSAGGC